jgi:hypothetical protein
MRFSLEKSEVKVSPPLNTKGKVSCIYGEKAKKQEKASSKRRAVLY